MQAYFPRKVKNSMFRKGISCKEFITVITTFIIALWMVGGSLFFLVPTFVQLLFLIILFVSLFLTNGIGGFRYIKKNISTRNLTHYSVLDWKFYK